MYNKKYKKLLDGQTLNNCLRFSPERFSKWVSVILCGNLCQFLVLV